MIKPNQTAARPHRNTGFTLLETLVVLIMVSFITLLLMQGLSFTLGVRVRITEETESRKTHHLTQHWFRQLTSGILAEKNNAPHAFTGTETAMRGLTLATLTEPPGAPAAFELSIASQAAHAELRYTDPRAQDWTLNRWPQARMQLNYLDQSGVWHNAWPPRETGPEDPQLPEAIRLHIQTPAGARVWLARVPANKHPRIDTKDLLGL